MAKVNEVARLESVIADMRAQMAAQSELVAGMIATQKAAQEQAAQAIATRRSNRQPVTAQTLTSGQRTALACLAIQGACHKQALVVTCSQLLASKPDMASKGFTLPKAGGYDTYMGGYVHTAGQSPRDYSRNAGTLIGLGLIMPTGPVYSISDEGKALVSSWGIGYTFPVVAPAAVVEQQADPKPVKQRKAK